MWLLRGVLFCCTLYCLLQGGLAVAQPEQKAVEELQFPAGRNKVRIPFKLIHNLIIVPVQINGSKPLYFVVDTGVDRVLLFELGVTDTISLNNVEHLTLRGLGKGEGLKAFASVGNKIKIAGVEASNQELLILEENVFDLSYRLGVNVNGIIGYPLFKNFVVEIDYANGYLTLYKPGKYPQNKKKRFTEVPLMIEGAKPYLNAEAVFPSGLRQPVKLIIDSGMSTSVMLYPPTLNGAILPSPTISAYLGRGLNGDILGEIGRIQALHIGGYRLHKPAASFPDTVSIRHALGMNNRNGNLGADVLQRFKVVFDYGNATMLLSPNFKYKKPFYFNLSGMELSSPIPGLNYYTISEVIPDSPAHVAGLKAGDALVTINGIKVADKSLAEVLHFFQSRPGRNLRLQVRRDTEAFETTLTLRDVI
ncbi:MULTISPECIES: aspartyl protease family protein [Rufibacter]|uniref:PDZ domain-containing protein n=1 Tax=Rufibacter quisquiliarum TaxID=1549639 RepID=A0A839GJI1_9BACT|nr:MULTISPECIES: aspartyl protease family protein [Rufibacter]MBA9075755.1 hypothetical protein [Rufibacter quisquiliarum]